MNKIKIFIIIIFLIFPVIAFAQIDYFFNTDSLLNDEEVLVEPEITLKDFKFVWSVDTYTPCTYEGRALPTRGSEVTINALLSVSGGNSNNLKYSWFLDDVFQESKSGYGQNNFKFHIRKFKGQSQTVLVKIFNDSRSFYMERSITIPITEPEVIVYPLYSSDEGNKLSFVPTEQKLSFIAKPYFFSIKKLTDLSFEWRFANQESTISSTYGANVLDLTINQKEDESISEQNLWINVGNKTNTYQKAYQKIKVQVW